MFIKHSNLTLLGKIRLKQWHGTANKGVTRGMWQGVGQETFTTQRKLHLWTCYDTSGFDYSDEWWNDYGTWVWEWRYVQMTETKVTYVWLFSFINMTRKVSDVLFVSERQ
jgi:hypothetical protein